MKKVSLILFLALFAFWFQAGQAHAWPWSKDMERQPSIKAQESPRPEPDGSVPVRGTDRAIPREEAGKVLHNPVPATPASIETGHTLFEIYCAVCHGANAKGNGPVAKKFVPPPDLTSKFIKRRADGFIYETIRSGGPVMPEYRESLSPTERWDVVNFLRRLQGK